MSELTILPAGSIKRLCVDRNQVRDHVRFGTDGPSILIVMGELLIPASEVEIRGDSRFVQSFQAPMSTGAAVWIETEAELAYR